MATRELIGRVVDYEGEPQVGTDVWLAAAGIAGVRGKTGADGSFVLSLGDEFVAGTYRLDALPTQGALGTHRDVKLDKSGPPAPVQLSVAGRSSVSGVAGWVFLILTIAVLCLVTDVYLDRHGFDLASVGRQDSAATPNSKKVSPELSDLLAIAKKQADEASAELASQEDLSEEDRAQAAADAIARFMAIDTLTAAEGVFSDIVSRRLGTLDSSKVAEVEALFAQAEKAGVDNDLEGLGAALGHLETAVYEPREPFFWSEKPTILLEGLYWALAATLIRLIFQTGLYLYKRRFLATAIPHHVAVAISVPVLAVLISFFLSLVKVSLSVSDVDLVLDMGNVYIVILVAALIGFAPWAAWDFMQELADLMFKKLRGLLSSEPSNS